MTGEWPVLDVDHADTVKKNNAWMNLREATTSQNKANSPLSIRNTSGLKGVCWNKLSKKWQAAISINRRQVYLGLYDTKEAAHEAFCAAAEKHHGEFFRAA